MNFEFNKLLKQVNNTLPPDITIRYEDKELSLYVSNKRHHTFGTGSKRQVMPYLGGMLAYSKIKE